MPATRSQSTVPRSDPLRIRDSNSPASSSSYSEQSKMPPPLLKLKDKTQQKQRPPKAAIVPGEVIEISDDDDNPPHHLNSQASMIGDFRRQINKLREVCWWHLYQFNDNL
jgi:hypothetical protein